MTAATCRECGAEPRAGARFCDACGAPIAEAPPAAEYKQVTVLFADVVGSMDIAAAVGPERLREIMSELINTCAAVVKRYGGSVNQFTGDGFMAVFGAPVTLEDHAIRACLTALAIQAEMGRLSRDADDRDGIILQLRVGLNSGRVIAGEVGSTTASYTTIGEQVGMAQRMESVAPAGGVMLSESTARLVENAAVLGEAETVQIKGAATPVKAVRLLAIAEHPPFQRSEPTLVGRAWELNTITGILDEAVNGAGCVVGVLGPPGIGKSRLVREAAAVAEGRGVEVIATHCDSHAADIPFVSALPWPEEPGPLVPGNGRLARRHRSSYRDRAHARTGDPWRGDLVHAHHRDRQRSAGAVRRHLAGNRRGIPVAEQCGQDVALGLALSNYACVLLRRGQQREQATGLLAQTREMAMQGRYSMPGVAVIDILAAEEKIRLGALDEAIELARTAFDDVLEGGSVIWSPMATSVLVDALLKRGTAADLREAEAAVGKLAAVPAEPGFVLTQIWLLRLRALLAQAQGDETAYRDYRDRYRKMAQELGFEGHVASAEAMA